jgi:hypothetical protein
MTWRPPHVTRDGHWFMVHVDGLNNLVEGCYYPGGETAHGYTSIIAQLSSSQAEAVRRAERAWLQASQGRGGQRGWLGGLP